MYGLIVGCIAAAVWGIINFATVITPMDSLLNYSMKKKVITDKIPLYFPNNRTQESLYGPSLEEPNKGTYLPAFICSIVTYLLTLGIIVALLVLYFGVKDEQSTNTMAIIGFVIMVVNQAVGAILNGHYKKKYAQHKDELINQIMKIKENKDSNSNQ